MALFFVFWDLMLFWHVTGWSLFFSVRSIRCYRTSQLHSCPHSFIYDFGFPNYYYKETQSKNILYYNSVRQCVLIFYLFIYFSKDIFTMRQGCSLLEIVPINYVADFIGNLSLPLFYIIVTIIICTFMIFIGFNLT